MTSLLPEGIAWRTSSYTGNNGACVEVAATPSEVHVRDTKNRTGGVLTFDNLQWRAFLSALR